MAIHHATVKRAASKGLAIEETSKNLMLRGDFGGKTGQSEFRFPLDFSAKDAVAAGILVQEISDRLQVTQASGRSNAFKASTGKGIVVSGDDLQVVIEEALGKLDRLPAATPAAATPAAAKPAKKAAKKADDEGEGDEGDPTQDEIDAGTDIADAEEEDEATAGSVVPDKYRRLYQERGDATHCGDDLAKALKTLLVNKDGETDLAVLEKLAAANGIDFTKYSQNQNRGWIGRARMSCGNILRGKQRRGEEVVLDISGGRFRGRARGRVASDV